MTFPLRLVSILVLALTGLDVSVAVAAGMQDVGQARPMREPIPVGGNVQASKLVWKVNPVYPEAVKAARISAVVLLTTTINENGEVSEIKVLRGHPLLDDPAVEAVKQWRYSPTYLNGEAVPVITTVSVSLHDGPFLAIDGSGILRDPSSQLEGEPLIEKLKSRKREIFVSPQPGVPFLTIEESLRGLQRQGVQNFELMGTYLFWEGRLFNTPSSPLIQSPEIVLDNDRLAALARASRHVEEIPRARDGRRMLLYRLFINEVSEIVSIDQLLRAQIAGSRSRTGKDTGHNARPPRN